MKKYILLPALFLIYNFTIKGQTYTVESIPFNLPIDVNTIDHSVIVDDTWSSVIALPFDFNFFGNNYNQVVVSGNGALSFDTTITGNFHFWTPAESNQLPSNVDAALKDGNIFFAIHDMNPQNAMTPNGFGWQVFGSSPNRMFVVSFLNVPQFACNDLLSTETLILYETTNVIEIYVADKPICDIWHDGRVALGIQNNDATVAYVPPNRNVGVWAAQNEAWRFTPEVLSIDENNFFQFKIYPNPVIDYFTLDFPVEFKNSTIEIIDIHGKVVLKQDYIENTLDVSEFVTGVYFLKIKSDLGKKVFKLLKK